MQVNKGKLLKVQLQEELEDFTCTQESVEVEINQFYSPLDLIFTFKSTKEIFNSDVNFKELLYYNLKSGKVDDISKKTREILEIPDIFQKILNNLHDQNCVGVLYNILIFNNDLKNLNILDFLQELFTKLESNSDLKRLLLLHKLLQIFTGDLQEIKKEKRKE
jgi:hypothetical protein